MNIYFYSFSKRSLWSSEYNMKAKLSYLKRQSLLIPSAYVVRDYLLFIYNSLYIFYSLSNDPLG